ncbi:MAG: DUF732 domain-containing protein [Actinomycetia bacterium]|nr:DUF732 domain-containing protein [Actinomycetes bacterium]MCH9709775.1 DUF732 domain-containing protein [Actinomycetes bacterium]MCH9767497.1 DUF732 domain-containing protein [Actinomycetes bacterium]
MCSRYVSTRIVAAAASAAMATMFLGSPIAHATEADDQFHSVLTTLGLDFDTPEQATAAGNNICDIVAEGSANNISPPEIRSSIIESLRGDGLAGSTAAQLMQGAVNAYCPEYDAVVAG